MIVFVPTEKQPGETRVAATPETTKKLIKLGVEVRVEAGAGSAAFFTDDAYREAGAQLIEGAEAGWQEADVVVKVASPGGDEGELTAMRRMKPGAVLIGLLAPFNFPAMVRALAEAKVTALPMELIPRITRAQSMDALSSQASIAGYKAAVLAASRLGRYFPLLMTAAGTIPPAKAVVMGAGVAGLQALATARRLGAVVEVSDIRPVVKEQVESLGGRFIDLPALESGAGEGGYAKEMGEDFLRRQREIVAEHVAAADVVITTALIPGKKAPVLLDRAMVEGMRPGSVIVDLATAQGGNCELSRPDEEVEHQGVLILGPSNLPANMPHDASTLYSRNVLDLLKTLLSEDGRLEIDLEDEVVAGTLLTHGGEVKNAIAAKMLEETVS